MPLDIENAMRQGFDRATERNGLILTAAFFVLGLASALVGNTLMTEIARDLAQTPVTAPALTLPVSAGLASLLWLATWVLSTVLAITAIRTLVSDETETVPPDFYRRNIGVTFLNMFVGGIVFALILGVGFALFIVPGVFLLVSLIFWTIYVAAEDQNFIEGMKNSWNLTSGQRIPVFLLGLALVAISFVVSLLLGLPQMLGLTTLGTLTSQAGSAFLTVFATATIARAYHQLTE